MEVSQIRTIVAEALRRHSAHTPDELQNDLPLGSDGLGLDSISIAEVLMECGGRAGVEIAPLLESGNLTVGRVVEYLKAHGGVTPAQ